MPGHCITTFSCFYKDSSWFNIWDSIAFSLHAFVVFSILLSKYVASVPIQIMEVIGAVYLQCTWSFIPETEEPDRLTQPEDISSATSISPSVICLYI